MYVNTSQSEMNRANTVTKLQRVSAAAAVSFKHDGERTQLGRLYQQGSAKLRFPKCYETGLEAVLINTAGGLTGGDRISWDFDLKRGSQVVATTQTCEKSYKSTSGNAHIHTGIALAEDSSLHWLPQETIVFDQSSLHRSFSVDMAGSSELLVIECIVFGRKAMGETVHNVDFRDCWRIKRDGGFIFADDLRLDGRETSAFRIGGNCAIASLLLVAPRSDEELQATVTRLRRACSLPSAGFSAFNGKIFGRILAPDSYQLRQALTPILKCLRGTGLPRVWRI